MNPNRATWLAFAALGVLALLLRAPNLAQRPMHGDEAVHALKFGQLLEQGTYQYDRFEYHGPTLNYLTLPVVWLSAKHSLSEVNEVTLRAVPVFFGILLILMTAILCQGLGRLAATVAALLTAISPAMSYFSRYYIQEMLLVCFTFGAIICGYRYLRWPNTGWAMATGCFVGLMHATKETCVIAWAAMLLSLLPFLFERSRKEGMSLWAAGRGVVRVRDLIAAMSVAAVISVLFFSSFFSNAAGVADSFLTYKTYFSRAAQDARHIHSWYYYLGLVAYFREGANPVWSEAAILLLALIGARAALHKRALVDADPLFVRFLVFYAMLMTGFYALIPYKTPWNLLNFLHPLILLAGCGTVVLMQFFSRRRSRALAVGLLGLAGVHLTRLAYLTNFKYYENPANPYVYAHPGQEVLTMVARVQEVAQAQPEKENLYMQVICPGDDYWPLPWYLRSFKQIGWWREVDEATPAAPLIVASPQVELAVLHKLYEQPPPGERPLYVPLFDSYMELRPGVELRGYVRKDLWDRFQNAGAFEHESQK